MCLGFSTHSLQHAAAPTGTVQQLMGHISHLQPKNKDVPTCWNSTTTSVRLWYKMAKAQNCLTTTLPSEVSLSPCCKRPSTKSRRNGHNSTQSSQWQLHEPRRSGSYHSSLP
ncbi:hypothetical protein Pelo_10578 [Pelomyxa schiedti]|nr:hypothetical protein Pelo_10578 [Pelomyxa schiedti]